jgi:precorrin-6Y C5,15-methyltransferase (decarboxylating)
MKKAYETQRYVAVVDATHPFALEVTKNIKESLVAQTIPYFRLLRDVTGDTKETVCRYATAEECAKALEKTIGKIFLTTGSKELATFCTPALKERLVVRVLPGMESISLCYENGMLGSQIVAMQGPFSEESNRAQFRQYNAAHVVTKQTGKTGGLPEKIAAAKAVGATMHMICCQEESSEQSYDLEGICKELEGICGCDLSPEKKVQTVVLAGIGTGMAENMTLEVKQAIDRADVVFGASRMLSVCPAGKKTYPFYLAKDIIPVLEKEKPETAVILFSGDCGFYSGAKKMEQQLQKVPEITIKMLPGISSVVAFASRLKTAWQDGFLYSTHGVAKEEWVPVFAHAIQHEKKCFFLTSGKEDVARMCQLLREITKPESEDLVVYGYQLGYPSEVVGELDLYSPPTADGLYVVYYYADKPCPKRLTPGLPDDSFTRGSVPMTKEEIRAMVLCKMNLYKDSVVYDIGGGTGSISIEVARMAPTIQVYTLERFADAVELLEKNKKDFNVYNMTVIPKEAPDGLQDLPPADIAFLGGTGGKLKEILACLYEINPQMQILFTAVTMDSVLAMEDALKEYPEAKVDVIQVAVSRLKPVGAYRMMMANNPIMIYNVLLYQNYH